MTTEEHTVTMLSIDQIDPETTRYKHAMIEAAREKPEAYAVYRVKFVCELKSSQKHEGYLLHIFSRSIIDDAVCFNLEEYFEDWIRVWITDNGFPEIMEPDREGYDRDFAQQLTAEGSDL